MVEAGRHPELGLRWGPEWLPLQGASGRAEGDSLWGQELLGVAPVGQELLGVAPVHRVPQACDQAPVDPGSSSESGTTRPMPHG